MSTSTGSGAARRPATPGHYAKGLAKREAILDAALPVFGQSGFHGASLREIARQCGVSHQSLMHYFPTKEELLLAVVRKRDERLRTHFGDAGGMSLGRLVDLAEYNVDVPGVIQLFNTASAEATSPEHPAHDYYADFYDRIIESTTDYLETAERHHLLAPGFTAASAARVVLAVQDGLQLQWLYDRAAVRVAELMRLVIATVVSVPLEELDALVATEQPPAEA
ncbi:TetR/AcrR family transcriptional regulator [Frondihabitans australicus]|uniref:TetR family transcriptional regulator n=1 Tax=Frondihabitans australicus TaxID=386892 RepID=A0A495IH55_9MICO|nr:TetR/AcrR family transcriptional regulator [Frondihabitans australicus]RKR75343.1 TetR family transcriptional regulator [Frondihabitans australicus]